MMTATGTTSAIPKDVSTDVELLMDLASKNADKLVVVMFYLESARACRAMDLIFTKMSNTFKAARFLKVKPDECKIAVARYGVTHMPTIIGFRNAVVLGSVKGAFPSEWEKLIRDNLSSSELEGTGDVGAFDGPGGKGDLYRYMDLSLCDCYNVDGADPKFIEWFLAREEKLVSSVDPEVILEIGFNQNVKIFSMTMKAPASSGPASVKIFINQVATLDFDTARKNPGHQLVILSPDDLDGVTPIQMRQTKFQSVRNIYLYIPSNLAGEDITEIDYITFFGEPVDHGLGVAGVKNQIVFLE